MKQDKFKDIKAGDIVYVVRTIRYSWNGIKRFYIPATVERTTKTQFIIKGGDRYKKDSGMLIGGEHYANAHYLGGKISRYSDTEITDQTKERDEFVKIANAVSAINNTEIKVHVESKNLVLIHEKIKEILELIDEEK